MTEIVSDYRHRNEDVVTPDLERYFGSLGDTLLTFFQAITGGVDWGEAVKPLMVHISPVLAPVFALYIAFAMLAVMNIVTGVFVESALISAREDKDYFVINGVREVFAGPDGVLSGSLTWDDFDSKLASPSMREYFKALDVDPSEAKGLFRLLDLDSSGSIDAEEFLNESELKNIVTRYSQFINFPIKLRTTRNVEKEVPVEDEEEEEEEKSEDEKSEDDLEVTEEDEDKEKKPKTKKVTEEITEWTVLNEAKALWTRNPSEVTDDEYDEFYRTLNPKGASDGALEKVHFVAEGEITFKSLLYIPAKATDAQYNDMLSEKKSGVKLYVRRVLISDEFEDLLPKYLGFVKGVVDSDDLPLNVSRETLAQSRVLKVMGKKLTRKVLDLFRKMSQAAEDAETASDSEDKEGDSEESEVEDINDAVQAYNTFWEEHGKALKFGVVDDRKNKGKLTKLLRYRTTSSDGKYVSLESYVERMKEDQKYIYFITGESMDKVQNSPFIEKVVKKGFEVIYMVEPIDEYVVRSMTEFDGIELASVTKDGLKLGDDEKKSLQKLKEEFKPVVKWLKEVYGERVEKVQVTNRLTTSPCAVVTGQYGWSSNMQRMMKGATLSSSQHQAMSAKMIFEINPRHPIVAALKEKIDSAGDDASIKDLAMLLLDSASLHRSSS